MLLSTLSVVMIHFQITSMILQLINKLRVVNINFQSIMNKKADLQEFICSHKPDIIVGTETWLSANVSNNEIIPAEWKFNVYRKERQDGNGSVMISVSKAIPSYKLTALQADCKLVCIQIIVGNGSKLVMIDHTLMTNILLMNYAFHFNN